MKSYEYITHGTCSRKIHFALEDGLIKQVSFEGGCNGNLKGIAKLVEGMEAKHVIERFSGTLCGNRQTSCPDQFAKALQEALQGQADS